MNPNGASPAKAVRTDIPFRLDRLPWSGFHWLLVTALGVTWVLDGLEATIVGTIAATLEDRAALGLTAGEIGVAGTLYLAGCIVGAIVFGHLTDKLGRKKLFTVTLLVYLAGSILTACAVNFWTFVLFRVITGLAIGGEYSAINSAIDELIPARLRGRVDLIINGTYWIGAMAGAAITIPLLDPALFPTWLGWRIAFGLGGIVGLGMIMARRFVPESPRWLLTHGRIEEAEKIMDQIESSARRGRARPECAAHSSADRTITIHQGARVGFGVIMRELVGPYRKRAILGLVLIASQAFFYNGISFTYPLVLKHFYGVAADRAGLYMLALAAANFLGPLALGRLFDTVGRRKMISATYLLSAVTVIITECFFLKSELTATSQTLYWALAFFFASAAASAGYLTVSEIFPLEMRALAIALFYAVGTAIGGLLAPAVFGDLVQTNQRDLLVLGYLGGAGLMMAAAVVEWFMGVDAERKALEDIALPFSAEEPAARGPTRPGAGQSGPETSRPGTATIAILAAGRA